MFSSTEAADGHEYKIKAAYLYHLSKFTQWPNSKTLKSNASLHICVLGDNPFGGLLDTLSEKSLRNRTITIKYRISSQDYNQCDIIYISKSKKNNLINILHKLSHFPVLTVSDIDNFTQEGGIVEFVIVRGKVRLQINYKASLHANLKISSKLLALATIVGGNKK